MTASINIKHVAKLANVSPATVSRVVNEKPGVAEKTRKRIVELINLVGYAPNLLARGLVAKKTNAIGLVVPRASEFVFSNPFYSEVLKGIGRVANRYKYQLVISFSGEDSYGLMYRSKIVGGIIVVSNRLYDSKIDELAKLKIPTVLIPGLLENSKFPSVNVNNVDGAFQATQHLISLGHKRIAFLCGAKDSKYYIERLVGFRNAFQKNYLSVCEELIVETDFSQSSGYHAMETLLHHKLPPTGVICINDITAVGALSALKENQLSVPDDISLVGFGDTPLAEITNPLLTTVREPFTAIGHWAARLLIDLISGKSRKSWNILLPVKLIIRSSTQKVKTT